MAQLSRLENASEKTSDVTEPRRRVGSGKRWPASPDGGVQGAQTMLLQCSERRKLGQGDREGKKVRP